MDWKVRGASLSWAPAERWKGYNLEAAALGCEKIHRLAVPFMGWKAAIETSHIRQYIVDIGIVMVG